ncbi:MAG: hypothetical protein QOI59_5858 [Gammaproteobacteria bacterium]|nr:hypothetical protein [Gammaproteobacteria bacterium]
MLEERYNLLALHRGKTEEEIVDRVTSVDVVEQGLHGHARAGNTGVPPRMSEELLTTDLLIRSKSTNRHPLRRHIPDRRRFRPKTFMKIETFIFDFHGCAYTFVTHKIRGLLTYKRGRIGRVRKLRPRFAGAAQRLLPALKGALVDVDWRTSCQPAMRSTHRLRV